MRWLMVLGLGAGLMTAGFGCSTKKAAVTPAAAAANTNTTGKPDNKVIVTPATTASGKVASVNPAGQFVVIAFQAGQMPAQGQKLVLYRANLKVGEVKVSKERLGQNAVADITAGQAQVGDEARTE